ncbi:Ubiquinone biosynthesis O-methyltransferase [subsurface metagenome]
MRHNLYFEMYEQEKTYWWHVGKRKIVISLLDRFLGDNGNNQQQIMVDIGCGTGLMLETMSQYGFAVGMDLSDEALFLCQKRKHRFLIKADANLTLPFDDSSFDLVTALDVLEHINNDGNAVEEFHRVLKEGGILITTVPAFAFLWSYWDKMLQHKRRYTLNTLVSLFTHNGFLIKKVSYSNFFIFLPVIGLRCVKTLLQRDKHSTQTSDFIDLPLLLNHIFIQMYRFEAFWLRTFKFPFGLSVVCVGQKRCYGRP